MKKTLRRLTLALMCLCLLPISAMAEFAFVQLGANLYLQPAENSQVLSQYSAGTWLEINEDGGDEEGEFGGALPAFLYVTGTDGLTGYVSINDVFVESMMDEASIAVVANNGKYVNLRQQPSKKSNVLAKINSGTPMLLTSTQKGFVGVTVGGVSGYMVSDMVKTSLKPIYGAYVSSQNGKGVMLRAEPSVNGAELATMPNGSSVSIYILGGGWAEVSYKNTRGYMMSKFISGNAPVPNPVPNPTPDDFYEVNMTAYVSNGGSSVRYRSGPSTDYSVVGKAASGTEIYVYSTSGTWSKISIGYGGDQVYMMSKYIVTVMPIDDDTDPYNPIDPVEPDWNSDETAD